MTSGVKNIIPVVESFKVTSIHGSNRVDHKCELQLFGVLTNFFLLPSLRQFDGIIGCDLLKEVGAVIDLQTDEIRSSAGVENIQYLSSKDVNFCGVEIQSVPADIEKQFHEIISKNQKVFADPEERLPFNTNVVASIHTSDDTPVYSRPYPYPVGVSDFVNKEIQDMLENGIIRPSRSPYNNPIWVVDKKGTDDDGRKKKRLVMDFRKLNERTVDDKYPVPDISNILANLGNARYFSKLDLKSGFHQILLREKDREKTAFSVNNGKYEFCRLAFGLKCAPSIFQRAIDDILRVKIGKFVFVYMDDIIIYSQSGADHLEHIEWVLSELFRSNMRVSVEKSEFFRSSVEYLGFIVSREGIRTCPDKIEAIINFPEPETLFSVRSFLGLASYYRRFVNGFAVIAKPLSEILKGENGSVSASKSKGVKVRLNVEQLNSFHKLRQSLSCEDVILPYPDFAKPFELTTDASSSGLGAVLAQGGRPITMISRTLKDAEKNYATNERELLAIVWSLQRLRNYLYNVKSLTIFTDHQPLTYAVSDKNCNAKIKRWKAFIDEHNARIVYKPGKENHVADALSRQAVNVIDDSSMATEHSEMSLTNVIRRTESPINCYNNQIIIEEGDEESTRTAILFRRKRRHVIRFSNIDTVFNQIREVINYKVVNAIHCELGVLANFQHRIVEAFPSTKFWFAPNLVVDITNTYEQKEIITVEHCRAHRCAQNVVETVLRDYYFPKMGRLAAEIVSNCRVCQENKYVRHPVLQSIGSTPIPDRPGEQIHVDIFSTDRKLFLTCVDKFSKFASVFPIQSRSIVDVTPTILQIINIYPDIKHIYCDNEAALNSRFITELLSRFGIQISNSPPQHSTSNGQVERFHSTLAELARCLKGQRQIDDTIELILISTIEYNKTIHSVTKETPRTVFFGPDLRPKTKRLLMTAEERVRSNRNKSRINRTFNVGDKVFVKTCRRHGNKLSIRFASRRVQADLGSTVLIRGRVVHKDNLR